MIVDFCAYLGHWPLYHLPISDADGLIRRMDRCGIACAFVSLVDGAFLLDPFDANARLVTLVGSVRDRLLPVGTVDLKLPFWREVVVDGIERLHLDGFRLHPSYHGYLLDSEEVSELATLLAAYQRPLFISAFLDEERFQHPAIRVAPVPIKTMAALIARAPHTTIVLNCLDVAEAGWLLEQPDLVLDNIFVDVNAMDKPFNGLAQLVQDHRSRRLVYGSQLPFLLPEATLALAQHSGLGARDIAAILHENWRTNWFCVN